MSESSRCEERVFQGIPVSAGVCRGKVYRLGEQRETVSKTSISESDVPFQLSRIEKAMIETRKQIQQVQHRVNEAMGAEEASIFEAHLLVLEDQTLVEEVSRLIAEEKVSAEYAFHTVAEKYASTLGAIDDEYLRERAKDMRDVIDRVMNNLMGRGERHDLVDMDEMCIVVSQDLTPSTTAQLDRKKVLGFATDMGSKTSHTAILARSLQIPAVVGLGAVSSQLQTGQYVLLDGFSGLLILNPTDQTLFEYGQLVRRKVDLEQRLRDVADQPAVTLDGKLIQMAANMEQVEDVDAVKASGAQGVGLYRTEFLFINRDRLPTEEEQAEAYRKVAAAIKPQPVIIRTLDLGGDKFMPHLHFPAEMNPFLGWRAIRFCLQELDVFRAQLRAILKASVEGNVKIMYPMISGLDELIQANDILEGCKKDLQAQGVPFNPDIEVGVMIEVPSAVLVADSLAKRVKFFSLGTNDLIQYSLAVDRLNQKIAHLYEPSHPAILRLIHMTVEAAHRHGVWVGICGEMASDPIMTPLLVGLGVDELSVAPPALPRLKFLIRRLKQSETFDLAQWALQQESPAEITARSEALIKSAAPALYEPTAHS